MDFFPVQCRINMVGARAGCDQSEKIKWNKGGNLDGNGLLWYDSQKVMQSEPIDFGESRLSMNEVSRCHNMIEQVLHTWINAERVWFWKVQHVHLYILWLNEFQWALYGLNIFSFHFRSINSSQDHLVETRYTQPVPFLLFQRFTEMNERNTTKSPHQHICSSHLVFLWTILWVDKGMKRCQSLGILSF